jgi:ABC-type multidrug transport system ATPase subunit
MQVKLANIGKNFQNHSVFKRVNIDIPSGYRGVILGGNGSGKSTLLKVISGALMPSEGRVTYHVNGQEIAADKAHKYVSFCGPYTDLIEDFTLVELIAFQAKFKAFLPHVDAKRILERLNLKRFENKLIKTYSSGMKQRVRLALSVMADTPLLLLDEPTSNLDPQGKEWYGELVGDFANKRTVIVASNYFKEEYAFTTEEINLSNYQ